MDLVKALPADATPAIQPGISSELRVHRLDLNRLDAGHQVSPVLDLLCDNPSPDRVIVTANDFDVFDVANRLPAQSLEDLVGSMLQPLQQLPAVGPMYLDRPSRSPGILLARRKPPAEAGTLECGPTTPGGELEQDGLYAVWANGTVAIPPGGAVSTLPQIAKPGMYFFHYTASGTPRRDDRPGLTFRAIGLYPGGRREELLGAGVAATTEMSPWLIRFDNKDAPLLQLRLEFPRAARYSAESFLYLRSVRVAAIVPPAGR